MRHAPGISEWQAKALRLARDAGKILKTEANLRTLESCCFHRWLAPRLNPDRYILTDAGLAALAHYDADEVQERIWEGRR